MLVIDNLQVDHGRMLFTGRRKILALLSDPIEDSSLECGPIPA